MAPPATHDGLVTRRELLAVGWTVKGIHHRVRAGHWQRLLPRVYLTTSGEPTARQRMRAALLYAGDGALLDGATALALRGFRYAPADTRVHVAVHRRRPRPQGFVVIHVATRPLYRRNCQGFPVVTVARAVATACAPLDLRAVRAVVAEAVQREFCTVQQLADEIEHRKSPVVRQVLDEVAGGAQSAPEIELRALVVAAALPPARYNEDVYAADGRWLARPDAWWPECGVVVEVDSAEWHVSPADWLRTIERHNRMAAAGVVVLHLTPKQIRADPARVIEQIRRALTGRSAA
jgi:hypothetical protein